MFHATRQGTGRYKRAGVSSRCACSSQAPRAGAVQPLAERANPFGPHPEWRVHLLGITCLSARTRSTERGFRCSCGRRYLDMRAHTRAAPIQQSARLGLQPHRPRSRHARRGSAPSLAVRLSIHAERPHLRYRVGHGRWLALFVASPDRPARCTGPDTTWTEGNVWDEFTAIWRTRFWLASGWECQGRRLSRARGSLCKRRAPGRERRQRQRPAKSLLVEHSHAPRPGVPMLPSNNSIRCRCGRESSGTLS